MENFVLKIKKFFGEPINLHITSKDELAVVIGSLDTSYKILELKVLGDLESVEDVADKIFKTEEPPKDMEFGGTGS